VRARIHVSCKTCLHPWPKRNPQLISRTQWIAHRESTDEWDIRQRGQGFDRLRQHSRFLQALVGALSAYTPSVPVTAHIVSISVGELSARAAPLTTPISD